MLGYGEASRRPMRWRRRLMRQLPGLAPGLVGAVVGAGLVAAMSGGALAPGRMALTAALTGVIFWLVQRRLGGNA
jgi:hypothetical protein